MNTSTDGYYARVALSFARKIDTDLVAFVRKVVTMTTGNAQYPDPDPALAVVTTSVDAFETAVHEALDGGKIAIATRNAARVELLALMRQLAAYVQGHCDADLLALISSGFDAVRAPTRASVPSAPQNPRLILTDKSGQLLFRYERGNNILNFSIQSAATANGPWKDEGISSSSRFLFEGLKPGEAIWARSCANGSAGSSEWSTPTTAMAI